jgi:hypothetical protein
MKKPDNQIAKLADVLMRKKAGALMRKKAAAPAAAAAPKPAVSAKATKGKRRPTAPAPAPATTTEDSGAYHQTVLRVPDELMTHANMLAMDLTEGIQRATGNHNLKVTANRILLVSLLRWDTVDSQDIERLERDGRAMRDKISAVRKKEAAPSGDMKCPMWLPRTENLQRRLQSLQRQFIQRGLHVAKYGANEPAICRQALWRWTQIDPKDVTFYLKLEESAG